MSICTAEEVSSAVNHLNRAYKEEAGLYMAVRDITARQYRALRQDGDLMSFADMLDEKEDLLALIGQIEADTVPAKDLLLATPPPEGPDRRKLACLLDRLTEIIEEIHLLESHNAALLEKVPQRRLQPAV